MRMIQPASGWPRLEFSLSAKQFVRRESIRLKTFYDCLTPGPSPNVRPVMPWDLRHDDPLRLTRSTNGGQRSSQFLLPSVTDSVGHLVPILEG